MVFYCNFIQSTYIGILEVLLSRQLSPNSTPIVLLRYSIVKAIQKSRLVFTTTSFLKWYDARAVLTSDMTRYQSKLWSFQNLANRVLSKEIGAYLWLLRSSNWCLYLKLIPNSFWYVNYFVSFITLMSMKYLLVFEPYNSSSIIQLTMIFIT